MCWEDYKMNTTLKKMWFNKWLLKKKKKKKKTTNKYKAEMWLSGCDV